MQDGNTSFAARARRAITRWVVGTVILALVGAVVFLTSRLNARTYRLVADGGKLVVMKGRPFPVGSLPYRPQDPFLVDAYAPVPLPEPAPPDLLIRAYSERDELDRALFVVLEGLATPRIAAGKPEDVEQGLYFLSRAQKLSGLSEDQRKALRGLQADVAFYQARGKLEEAQRTVTDALEQLRLAAGRPGPKASAARATAEPLGQAAHALEAALRAAGSNAQQTPLSVPSDAADAGTSPPGDGGGAVELPTP